MSQVNTQNSGEASKSDDSSLTPDLNAWRKDTCPNASPRRGKGRSTKKFSSSFRNTSWVPEPRSSQPDTRRYRTHNRTSQFRAHKYEGLAQFKMVPCVMAENRPRPFMGSCCSKCFPLSRASVVDKSVFCLSVCNALHIPLFQRFDSSYVLNILKRNQKQMYPEVSFEVSQNDRVLHAVKNAYKECKGEYSDLDESSQAVLKTVQLHRAKEILESFKSSVSTTLLQFSSVVMQYALSKVFDGILVHKGQMEILKAASQENVPIIYLPVYRSHLDYFLVSYILYTNSLKVPLVAVENGLYIPFFRYILRFLGAFFIKRRTSCDKSKKDPVYWAVLQSYIAESLKAGHSLQYFIEGGRSRSGNPNIPNTGMLTVAVESVLKESVEDVFISTVSISYEKIIEGNFIAEQLGQPKEKETVFSFLYSIWKFMHLNFGNVRYTFGQPVSIKEFLQTSKKKLPSKLPGTETPPSSSSSSDETNIECIHMNKSQLRSVIHDLSQHIIYDATFSTSLMSTQLIAFLFITQYRKGATQQQLQNSLDWLRSELLAKKRDVGFVGESLPVVKRAVDLLGKQLVMTEMIDMEWTSSDMENNNVKITVYKPAMKLPHILELQYYANTVVPVFLLDSMLVNAVYALVDVEICHFRHCDSMLYVLRDKLIDKATELSEMLQFEFIAIPPCADILFSFSDILDELIQKDCLHVAGMGITSQPARYNRKAHHLSFQSDEEEEEIQVLKEQQLKIDLTEESINHLEFLRNILSPYIESYWLAASTLLKLVDEIKEESVLIQEMQVTAQDKLYKGLLAYEESFSADTFKNSLKLFERWHVVEHYLQDGIKIVYLNDSYNCIERVNDIIARIEDFRK